MRIDKLPKLPAEKTKQKNAQTIEGQIITKIFGNIELTVEEESSLNNLASFYTELNSVLKSINYSLLSQKEVNHLIHYIDKAFYYTIVHSKKIQIKKTFRIVNNYSILKSDDSITKVGHLTYPPDHVVRSKNQFNRANTPKSSIFYGSQDVETALFELQPSAGAKVTIGEWTPIDSDMFNLNIVFHNEVIHNGENIPSIVKSQYQNFIKGSNENVKLYLQQYLDILGHEFSKPVFHHQDYIVSAILTAKIFEHSRFRQAKLDGILYPSVNNNFSTLNIALKKSTARHKFKLTKVTEFVVKKTFYDTVWDGKLENDSPIKTLVEADNKRETTNIIDNEIIW